MNKETFYNLLGWAFSEKNPGYKPKTIESPNGDGKWDDLKQYAHIAPKYFNKDTPDLVRYTYWKEFALAQSICEQEDLPPASLDSTLRLLKYPAGVGGHVHTDFDLFTLSCWRNDVSALQLNIPNSVRCFHRRWAEHHLHFGEMLTEWCGHEATPHRVQARPFEQHAAVFFVIPEHDLVLNDETGITVGEWLKERIVRSRKEK